MSNSPEPDPIHTALHDLFAQAFFENADIDQEEIPEEDKLTLEDLEPVEVIENLKELISDLLNDKRLNKNSDASSLKSTNQQFESMIQKLENEVRTHIRTEQQLKLHLEGIQGKLDELQGDKQLSSQDSEYENDDRKLTSMKAKLAFFESNVKTLEQQNRQLTVKVENQSKELQKVKVDFEQCKDQLLHKSEQCGRLKQQLETVNSRPVTRDKQKRASSVSYYNKEIIIKQQEHTRQPSFDRPDSKKNLKTRDNPSRQRSSHSRQSSYDAGASSKQHLEGFYKRSKRPAGSKSIQPDDKILRGKPVIFSINPPAKGRKGQTHIRAKTSMRFYSNPSV